ncbi:MAG: hypothetical protein MK185_00665 [Saccharospirillaceae bacterium]|nr:hypothetical protein A3759_08555 [Thalassolituus sp. HI0120]MCH2039133.1 hypothetical protein [Saccharospirillaceae bacterium]
MKILFYAVLIVCSAPAVAVTGEDLIEKVEQYYRLESEGDYQTITQMFQPGGEVSYALDFGLLIPTHEINFKVIDVSSFAALQDEEDVDIFNIQSVVRSAEVNESEGKVVINLEWDYRSADGDGSVIAIDTFDFVIQEQQIFIRAYYSEQQY